MDSKLNNISNGWSEKTNGTLFALVSVIATVDSLDTVYCVLREPNVKHNPSSPSVATRGGGDFESDFIGRGRREERP
jgi:hypothetical protein